jgi:DNA-binding IclR family transcriptional regulator
MHNPYLTASGILFLAFLPLDGTARLREAFPFHDHATKGWRTADELEKFLKRVRKDGVCVLPFRGQELYRVAAPVLTGHGEFVSAIGAALPVRTSDEAARRSLRAAVIKAGKALGQEASA